MQQNWRIMNRKEFFELLAQAKQQSGIGTKKLSLKTRQWPQALCRFERGLNNSNLVKILDYLQAIGFTMVISNQDDSIAFQDYDKIIDWIKVARRGRYSQRALAEAIGYSSVHVAYFESKKALLTIDLFLKIVDLLGFSLNVVSNN